MAAVALVRTLAWRLLVRVLGVELLEGFAVGLQGHVVELDEFAGQSGLEAAAEVGPAPVVLCALGQAGGAVGVRPAAGLRTPVAARHPAETSTLMRRKSPAPTFRNVSEPILSRAGLASIAFNRATYLGATRSNVLTASKLSPPDFTFT